MGRRKFPVKAKPAEAADPKKSIFGVSRLVSYHIVSVVFLLITVLLQSLRYR